MRNQAAKKYQKEVETQLWKLVLLKDSSHGQGKREDGDQPHAWGRPCSLAKHEGLGYQSH